MSLTTELVRGTKLGQWLEDTTQVARRPVALCFCSCDRICSGEIFLIASDLFKVPGD